MRATLRDRLLLGLLLFDGVTAVGGGLALMAGVVPEQPAWVRHTGFTGLYFPGLVLMAVVGGSALVAAVAMLKRVEGWPLVSLLSGVVMVFWIVGEVASIRAFHVLQVVYLVTGVLVVCWTPSGPAVRSPPRPRTAAPR
jgi:hypothetical protein